MTLVLAIACDDGIVIGSDSAFSEAEIGTKHPSAKIKQLCDCPILYGASGDVGLAQKVDEALKAYKPKTLLKQIRSGIKSLVVLELKASIEQHVPYPNPSFHLPPAVILLFAGVLDGHPWILEIERDARDTLYDESMGNFAAIGSGKLLAHAFFRPHFGTKRTLRTGKVLAYRVLDDAISIAGAGLALPLHVHTISGGGTVTEIGEAEMTELNNTVNAWREIERDSLGRALSPAADEPALAIPTPRVDPAG